MTDLIVARVPSHIVHLSCAGTIPMITDAKNEGIPLTVETCPHYLTLAAEDVPAKATQFKCCPPIRNKANQVTLQNRRFHIRQLSKLNPKLCVEEKNPRELSSTTQEHLVALFYCFFFQINTTQYLKETIIT